MAAPSSIQTKTSQLGLELFYTCPVTVKSSVISKAYFCAVTDTHLLMFSGKGRIEDSYAWTDLSKIFMNSNMVNVTFGEKEFTVTSETSEALYNSIRDLLSHIRTQQELRNIFTLQVDSESSDYGALCRLNEFASQHMQATRDIQVLKDLITFGKTSFSLNDLSQRCVYESINDVLAIVQLLGTVEVLDIVCLDPSTDFFPVMHYELGVKFLRFECENRQTFVNFLRKLVNADDVLSGIGFRYTKIDRNCLNIIKEIVQKKELKCLEFESSLGENDAEYFIVEVLPALPSLISLSMNSISNLVVQPVLERCSQMRFISLRNCGLHIDESLKVISKYGNIHRADLSWNIGTLKSGLEFTLSTTLKEVVLDHCIFEDESLQHIFCFLLENLPRKSILSARNIQASEITWNASLPVISRMRNCKIAELIWDGNRVSPEFMTFIENLEKLTYLSMSGCFNSTDEDLVDRFALIVRYSETLKTLVCRGTEEKYLDELLIRVLIAAGASKSLKTVDLRNNRGSSVYFDGITTIVEENVGITKLAFDGVKPDDREKFVEFLRDVSHYKIKESLSFPVNDLSFLMNQQKLTQEMYDQLITAFTIPSPSDYHKPVRVFLYDSNENHPYYLTRNAEALLHEFPTADSYKMSPVRRLLKRVRRNSDCEIRTGVPEIVQDIINAGQRTASVYGITINESELRDFDGVKLNDGESIEQSPSIPVALVRKYHSCVIEQTPAPVSHVEEALTPRKVIRRVVRRTVVRTSPSQQIPTGDGTTKTPMRRLIKKRIKVISKSARKQLDEEDLANIEKKNKLKMKKLAAETPRKPFVRYTPPRTRQREEAISSMSELTEGQMEVKSKLATPVEIKTRPRRRLLAQNA